MTTHAQPQKFDAPGTTKASPTPRGYLGAAVRSGIEFIGQKGLAQRVRADATPPVIAAMDKPPSMMSWQDSPVLDELETLLAKHGGRESCVELGVFAARKLGGSIVQPVLRFALQLFGNTPKSLFANLDRFYPMVTRGLSYGYQPISASEGIVVLNAHGSDIPPALYDVTRGNLMYMLELSGSTGTVSPPEVKSSNDQRTVVHYAVRWG